MFRAMRDFADGLLGLFEPYIYERDGVISYIAADGELFACSKRPERALDIAPGKIEIWIVRD
jgi:hypothetical protein